MSIQLRIAFSVLALIAACLLAACGPDDHCSRPGDIKVKNGQSHVCVSTDNGPMWQ